MFTTSADEPSPAQDLRGIIRPTWAGWGIRPPKVSSIIGVANCFCKWRGLQAARAKGQVFGTLPRQTSLFQALVHSTCQGSGEEGQTLRKPHMEPGLPESRLAFTAEDAGIAVLLTEPSTSEKVPGFQGFILDMDAVPIKESSWEYNSFNAIF